MHGATMKIAKQKLCNRFKESILKYLYSLYKYMRTKNQTVCQGVLNGDFMRPWDEAVMACSDNTPDLDLSNRRTANKLHSI